jgi:alginate O-acetyltransferase complex protein AlgI
MKGWRKQFMLFSSVLFLFLFLPLVLVIYYGLLRTRNSRNVFLLLASLFFYAWGEPKFVFLMIACIVFNYVCGLLVDKFRQDKTKAYTVLTIMLIGNLSVMGIFKYLVFIIKNLNAGFGLQLTVPNIALPIGISFFTFQSISYVVDVYRGRGQALKNPLNVGLYISLFPQLIAGPIVRYETVADQIYNRKETEADFANGVLRFVEGMGKKVLFSNNFALIADKAFGLPMENLSVSMAWMGAIAYTLQIYFDFSGYSDMAIGLGKMFGFHFNENFNAPYISKSISEFWRRWHISLGTWFRDYVYFPLGGSRVDTKWKLVRNLFVVWLLTGVWHGANWTFMAWGVYFGLFIMLEKFTGLDKYLVKKKVLGHLYAMLLVVFGWVLFRAETIGQAGQYLKAMFGLNGNIIYGNLAKLYLWENLHLFILGILFSLPIRQWFCTKFPSFSKKLSVPYGICMVLIFMTAIAYLVKGSYNPFIYFNF